MDTSDKPAATSGLAEQQKFEVEDASGKKSVVSKDNNRETPWGGEVVVKREMQC